MTALAAVSVSLLTDCGFVHDVHITCPYRMIAVDIDEPMSIGYDLVGGSFVSRIDETLFAYGFDKRFIVAKQLSRSDRSVTGASPTISFWMAD